MRAEQYDRHEDVGFEVAYAFVKGDMESGKFGFVYFGMSTRSGPAENTCYLPGWLYFLASLNL